MHSSISEAVKQHQPFAVYRIVPTKRRSVELSFESSAIDAGKHASSNGWMQRPFMPSQQNYLSEQERQCASARLLELFRSEGCSFSQMLPADSLQIIDLICDTAGVRSDPGRLSLHDR